MALDNYIASHFLKLFLLLQMQKARGGSIINVASILSSIVGHDQYGPYGATKGAVIGLTKGLAAEHVRDTIRWGRWMGNWYK